MKKIELKINHIIKDELQAINNLNYYLENYLLSFGIAKKDLDSFIHAPRITDEDNPMNLLNMNLAVSIAERECTKPNAKVFVQVDSDCDGYTSAAIVINYLKRRYPELSIEYRLHSGKEHGVVVETVPENTTLVIIPDAGSNQNEEVQALIDKGCAVIILDHHEINGDIMNFPNVALVNNQVSPAFNNKYMSGAGVTYMFCKAIDLKYGDFISHDYRDLAAIGIIADAMNMTSLGNNFLAYHGLRNIKNKFIKEIAIKQARAISNPDKLTKMNVAWYIAPVINGVIRSGSIEDKETVFRAMTENDCCEHFAHEWRGEVKQETLYQLAARLAVNAKSRQDSNKKKSFEWLCETIENNNWQKDNLIIVPLTSDQTSKVSANVTGLIAMELVKHYNRPCLVLRETEYEGQSMYGGSGRNGKFYALPSLLDFLRDSNLTEYVAGHANAHGCFIKEENIQPLRDLANSTIDARAFDDTVFEVDYWFKTNEVIDRNMLMQFAENDSLYGNSIPAPLFAFDFNIKAEEMKVLGAKQSTVKFSHEGVDFITFEGADLIQQIHEKGSGHLQIIGRPQINEFNGWRNLQVNIEDVSFSEWVNVPSTLLDLI